MSNDINLLLHINEEAKKKERRIKFFNFLSSTILIAIGIISLIIFLLIRFFSSDPVIKEQREIAKEIGKFQEKQLKAFILNNRVENIEKVLSKRKNLSKNTDALLSKTPTNFYIDSFSLDDKTFSITGHSISLSAIGDLIDDFSDMVKKKENLKSLKLNSLVLDEAKNVYVVSLIGEL